MVKAPEPRAVVIERSFYSAVPGAGETALGLVRATLDEKATKD